MPVKKLLWLLPLVLLAACGGENEPRTGTSSEAATAAIAEIADTTAAGDAPEVLSSQNRKMIRTADFHCKVPDVLGAVTRLEREVLAMDGIIEESHVNNTTGDEKTIAYKPDSLKRVQVYHTTAMLTLRVPASLLDSVINAIPDGASFVESRRLAQRDVTLKYLSNRLLNKPAENSDKTKKALQLATDSRDVIAVQRSDDARTERTISRHIENLQLMDNVMYATLTVAFSQPEQVFIQTIVNPDYVATVPFGTRAGIAMQGGVELIGDISIGLLTIWPLLLIILTGLSVGFIVMRQKRRLQGVS